MLGRMSSLPPDTAGTLQPLGAQLLVRGWLSANNIVFPGTGAVVDTGYVAHAAQTRALVGHALQGRPLRRILNTHLHSDHCGGNAELARHWKDTRIDVPAGYAPRVRPWDHAGLGYLECDQQCEPFEVDGFLHAGERLRLGTRDWEVHATPGHDADAVVLFEPQSRTLVSGDALWEKRLAIIFPALAGGAGGFGEAQRALDLIEQLAPRLVLPGHGEAFTDVAGALRASRQRLDAFAAAPGRHHQYAARALLTYHLLEHRRRTRGQLERWLLDVPVLQAARADDPAAFARETVQRLLADGVLRPDGEWVEMAG